MTAYRTPPDLACWRGRVDAEPMSRSGAHRLAAFLLAVFGLAFIAPMTAPAAAVSASGIAPVESIRLTGSLAAYR